MSGPQHTSKWALIGAGFDYYLVTRMEEFLIMHTTPIKGAAGNGSANSRPIRVLYSLKAVPQEP